MSEIKLIKSFANATDEANDGVARVCTFEPDDMSLLITSVCNTLKAEISVFNAYLNPPAGLSHIS